MLLVRKVRPVASVVPTKLVSGFVPVLPTVSQVYAFNAVVRWLPSGSCARCCQDIPAAPKGSAASELVDEA